MYFTFSLRTLWQNRINDNTSSRQVVCFQIHRWSYNLKKHLVNYHRFSIHTSRARIYFLFQINRTQKAHTRRQSRESSSLSWKQSQDEELDNLCWEEEETYLTHHLDSWFPDHHLTSRPDSLFLRDSQSPSKGKEISILQSPRLLRHNFSWEEGILASFFLICQSNHCEASCQLLNFFELRARSWGESIFFPRSHYKVQNIRTGRVK